MGKLDGKVVLVTGSSTGFGRVVAIDAAKEGAKVMCADIVKKPLDGEVFEPGIDTDDYLRQQGFEAGFFQFDVSSNAACHSLIEETVRMFGRVDSVIHSAGVWKGYLVMHEEPESVWDHHMNINGKGTYNISHAIIPQMIKQGTGGSIVNVSSLSGIRVLKGVSTYNASKWAVTGFTKAIAIEYGEYGIRSNCICPNFMETGMTKQYFADDDFVNAIVAKTPLRRIQTTKDLSNMAIFLCSDDASIITAQAIAVDGGISEFIG